MAKHDGLDTEDKVRLLRALAHHVHRKRPLDEVLMEQVELELRGSRRRLYRAAAEALAEGQVMTALRSLELVGEEAALMLDLIVEAGDHRQVSMALNRLAEFVEAA